jgi:ADP-heptose:LPS heptosyltransferase
MHALLHKLHKKNVLLVGGTNDRSYYEQFTSSSVINTAGTFSLEESAVLLEHARHVFTTDSGPMHLAAAMNAPMTCFFGPTNPKRKAPLSNNVTTIWTDQSIYDPQYELYGKKPKGTFFTHVEDAL